VCAVKEKWVARHSPKKPDLQSIGFGSRQPSQVALVSPIEKRPAFEVLTLNGVIGEQLHQRGAFDVYGFVW
jgi:hypothetical protein